MDRCVPVHRYPVGADADDLDETEGRHAAHCRGGDQDPYGACPQGGLDAEGIALGEAGQPSVAVDDAGDPDDQDHSGDAEYELQVCHGGCLSAPVGVSGIGNELWICFVEYRFTVLAAHYGGGENNSIL